MSNPSLPALPLSHAESSAEVRARGHVIRYRRWGTGRTVVVFGSPDDTSEVWSELLDVLGAGFRLLVPEPPAAEEDVPCWLSSFLEGLGIPSVRILAAGGLCLPVLRLALVEGDQIAGVVLVAEAGRPGAAGAETLEAIIRELTVPVLVIDRGLPADELVPLVTEFLSAG